MRERERAGEGQREREGKRIPSRLCTVSPESNVGLNLTNHEIMTWAEIQSWTLNWPSHPGALGIYFKFMYLFLREREHEQRRGSKGGRERIPSRLCTVSPEPSAGLKPMNREIMTSAEIKSRTFNQLSHPGAPKSHILKINFSYFFLLFECGY